MHLRHASAASVIVGMVLAAAVAQAEGAGQNPEARRLRLAPLPVAPTDDRCPAAAGETCISATPTAPAPSDVQTIVDRDAFRVRGLAIRSGDRWFVRRSGFAGLGWDGRWSSQVIVGSWRIVEGSSGFVEGDPPERSFYACEHFFLVCTGDHGERPRCSEIIRLGRLAHCGGPRQCDSLRGVDDHATISGTGRIAAADTNGIAEISYRLALGSEAVPGKGRVLPTERMAGPFASVDAWCGEAGCESLPAGSAQSLSPPFEQVMLLVRPGQPGRQHLAVSSGGAWFVQAQPLGEASARAGAQTVSVGKVESEARTLLVRGKQRYEDAASGEPPRVCSFFFVACHAADGGAPLCSRSVATVRAKRCYPHRLCQWLGDELTVKAAGPSGIDVNGKRFEIVDAAR